MENHVVKVEKEKRMHLGNQNEPEFALGIDGPIPQNPELEDWCQTMPMWPPGHELYPEIKSQNDNVERMEFEEDPTLTQVNGGNDEIGFNLPYEGEKKVYEDLSGPLNNAVHIDFSSDWKGYQEDFMQLTEEVPAYRMDVLSNNFCETQLHLEERKVLDQGNYGPLSPLSPLPNIASYFERDNNTNQIPTTRSRKSSTSSGKIGKVSHKMEKMKLNNVQEVNEKPFRSRKTKEEMNRMTAEEKSNRKKEQNRLNAKSCNKRKADKKTEMQEKLPILQQELEGIRESNMNQEYQLIRSYGNDLFPYDNNSPFGTPGDFVDTIQYNKEFTMKSIEKENDVVIAVLEKKAQDSESTYKSKQTNDGTCAANTFASQKSRAKTAFEIASLEYQTEILNLRIRQEASVGEMLRELANKVNAQLAHLGFQPLPAVMEHPNAKKIDPH